MPGARGAWATIVFELGNLALIENLWTPAHQAVEMSNYEELTRVLDEGADPNEVCCGQTLLTHAVDLEGDSAMQTGEPANTAMTAILLAYGADPQFPAEDGATPLDVAAQYGHSMAANLLTRWIQLATRK